jgi:hypothetical protein
MAQDKTEKPDAFKAVIAAKKLDFRRTDLPHQSRGRDLTAAEDALAGALMEIYAAGATGPEAVAKGLTERGVVAPGSGSSDWTAESVAEELVALNADLDRAYEENGFGG